MSGNDIRIFKFGGASVKSPDGLKNLAKIISEYSGKLVVVVSAMGKTTNALERILGYFFKGDGNLWNDFTNLKDYHLSITYDLFNDQNAQVYKLLNKCFSDLEHYLRETKPTDYNFDYDQIVSFGEIISTLIVSEYLNAKGIVNHWVDIRKVLQTDYNYREGNIDYNNSALNSQNVFSFENSSIYVTQGFIGGTPTGTTTTLGREGSDYTAAILANLLDARDVTIWKDVDGVLNADPRIFSNTVRLNTVTFKEAIELAYCGAQIIHPKTIKPLQNKKIPLYVKSFVNPGGEGTKIVESEIRVEFPPVLILKSNQILISLTPKDFSFVIEDCLSKIFAILYKHRVKANLVQSSAINFSICVDDEEHFLPGAIKELQADFSVKYNKNLKLLTVRHYSDEVIRKLTKDRTIFLEQRTRSTARFVLENVNETLTQL